MTKTNIYERKKKLEQKENKLKQLKASLNVQERKGRTRKLIELGGLVSKANMDTWNRNTLLGALLSAKEKENDSSQIDLWSHKGGGAFAKEKKYQSPVIVKFCERPHEDTRHKLKELGLKWNDLRQEWEGYTDLEKLKGILSTEKADIQNIAY